MSTPLRETLGWNLTRYLVWVVAATVLPAVAAQQESDTAEEANLAQPTKGRVIGVVGSSVAHGYRSSLERSNDGRNGYVHRLKRLLQPRDWTTLTTLSVPGDTTERVLARMDQDVFGVADYAIIGLSLENEGIRGRDPRAIFKQYATNLRKIVKRCRNHGVVPIVGLCYPCNSYDQTHYEFIEKMNLLINKWNVPSVNFLGAADDGAGHWADGYSIDADHPNNDGYEEMFYAIVPTLFDALQAGKPRPRKAVRSEFVTIKASDGNTPLSFMPTDTMHSFTVAFRIRTPYAGTVAVITALPAASFIEIIEGGQVRYVSSAGDEIQTDKRVSTKKWHDIVLSHRHAQGQTTLYLDGRSAGRVSEKLVPQRFVLGGPGHQGKGSAPGQADYQEWMVYRSALNDAEAKAIHRRRLQQASLEVFAPLSETTIAAGAAIQNQAQSLSQIVAYPSE